MDIIEFYLLEQKHLHEGMRDNVSDLTLEEWHYKAEGTASSIAFLIWHCVRTEDNILRFILQGRPTLWGEGNWYERLGLPPRVQGTGMSTDEARELHIADPALFMQYTDQVWKEYEEYLAGITDSGAALSEKTVVVKPVGTMPAILAIGQTCITHCFTHLGEIAHLRGMMGKNGLPS
ncbi:MAG: hypothetical protein PVS3B1_32330 [Ktedonobacteraceae bacterium]